MPITTYFCLAIASAPKTTVAYYLPHVFASIPTPYMFLLITHPNKTNKNNTSTNHLSLVINYSYYYPYSQHTYYGVMLLRYLQILHSHPHRPPHCQIILNLWT
jgi:hypothetical protein